MFVKLVAQIKLLPTEEQQKALKETIEAANAAANRISKEAFDARVFKRFDLHYRLYNIIRLETSLAAQVVGLLFAKVADAYKLDRLTLRTFRKYGAIAFDSRILRYMPDKNLVSISTVNGREQIPFVCGEHQMQLLQGQRGESELCLVDGEFYLMAVCDVEEQPLREVNGFLGVDLGIVQLASDSEGNQYSGSAIRAVRRRMRKLRAGLQQCGSKSSKHHLQRLRRRQSRFTRWVNHNISRRIVETAADLGKALALEDLSGIRERGNGLRHGAPRTYRFNREMRFELGNWSFFQLQQMIEYKARRAGLPVVFVDPRNTSRSCHVCGYCDKHNRKSQSKFQCLSCGLDMNADLNAALNISARGNVTCPMDGAVAC